MLRFAHPEFLYFIAFVPVIFGLFMLMQVRKKRALQQLGDPALLRRLFPDASTAKPWVKGALTSLALILIAIGLANPQIGTRLEEVKREGVDIIIALDVSNSMKAEDIRPNRLERAKQAISRLIDRLENDRIGIVVFAGQAYVQLPITTDFGAAKLFLSTIDTDIIPTQGTDIGAAIDLSMQSFVGTDNKYKALVIITDGEDNEGTGQEAALRAREAGVIIHTIGMGTENGAPIPVYNRNGMQIDFLKDQNGSIVLSRLDQATLEKISAEGKGVFVRASNADDGLNAVLKEISRMDKKAFGTKVYTGYEDRFQYFIGAGLLILLLEFSMSNRKSKWIERMNLFGEKK